MQRAGVVGCGQMGAGIAEVCARAGLDTVVVEQDARSLGLGEERVVASMARAVAKGRLTESDRDLALKHLTFTTQLDALADREIVMEAIVESRDEKTALYAQLDDVVTPRAILASNTSSIPISRLAAGTRHPGRVIGLHFFQPVPVLDLVELVPSLVTDAEVVEATSRFAADVLARKVVRAPDRAGFIVNALLIPYLLSAIRMYESGLAGAEDIDAAMVKGCGHPMGPLTLADFIGLDTTMAIAESLYEEQRETLFAPPAILARMVESGHLGRKSGRGFYVYD